MDSHHFLNFLVATTEGILHKLYKHVLTIANISDTLIHPMQLHSISSKPISSIWGFPYMGWMIWASYFRKPSYPHEISISQYSNSCCSWPSPPLGARQSTSVRALRTDAAAHPSHLPGVGPSGLTPGSAAGAQQLWKEVPRCHCERFMSWA
jgi:hypothetical protein